MDLGMPETATTTYDTEARVHTLRIGPMTSYVKLRPHLFSFLEQASANPCDPCHLVAIPNPTYSP